MMKRIRSPLQEVPGVGPSIAIDLEKLGIAATKDLIGKDPEVLYHQLCIEEGQQMDRCVLYVFRCAVYYAENQFHDPELLKWWNWSDHKKSLHRKN